MRVVVAVLAVLVSMASQANVVGSDIQNFNPTTNGLDFVTVESSETLEPGIINFGLFFNYAVNVLPNYENITTQKRTDFQDSLTGMDFNVGFGVLGGWDLGLSIPQVVLQSATDRNDVVQGKISQTGLTEFRVNTKYQLWGNDQGGGAISGVVNFNQIIDNPFAGKDPGPTYNLQFIYDTTFGQSAAGFNLGYRLRNPGDAVVPEIEPFKSQYIASFAISRMIESWRSKFITEIFAGFPAESSAISSDRDLSSVELLGGIKHDLYENLALHAGAGTELLHGSSTADWRIYAGLNWVTNALVRNDDARIYRQDESGEIDYGYFGTAKAPFGPAPGSGVEKFVARDVLFDFNSAKVKPEFARALGTLAKYLNEPPVFKEVTIEGHTDSMGSEDYNQKLSQRRANSVREVLINEFGLEAKKIKAVGIGEVRPIADNTNWQGRAKNRRVEFKVER